MRPAPPRCFRSQSPRRTDPDGAPAAFRRPGAGQDNRPEAVHCYTNVSHLTPAVSPGTDRVYRHPRQPGVCPE
ncbi:hypothetical protein RHCRD62_80003 [Rhodococcus sp. RD6.2]|nr:hypothetical protein RHCRD62_80003 [Rhodococcus sp. RD6.2]